jgi:preprotein translocase subunit YajC
MKILSDVLNLFYPTNAYAAGAAVGGSSLQSEIWSFAPLIAIVVIFYLLVILPQQKRTKDHKKMIDSLKIGDQVITNGGIYGVVAGIADQVFTLEIAKDVKIKVAKNTIATKAS